MMLKAALGDHCRGTGLLRTSDVSDETFDRGSHALNLGDGMNLRVLSMKSSGLVDLVARKGQDDAGSHRILP